jgi:outer membrane lipoprotein carrier protein
MSHTIRHAMKPSFTRLLSAVNIFALGAALHTSAFAETGLEAMRSFIAAQKSVSGEFVQSTVGKTNKQTGSFALSKPAQFRWAIQKPFEQLIVSDGKTLTQWDVDLNQATVRSADGLLANTPAALLLGGAAVEKQFGLVDAGNDEGLAWVQATPKSTDGPFKSIKLGFKDGAPAALIAQDAFGGTSRIDFKNLSTKAVDAAQFQFTAPKGADVVKM